MLLIVALVVVGPKDLPRLMHMAGRWMGKARAMASDFRKSFDEMARQAELELEEICSLRNERPLAEQGSSSISKHVILPPDQKLDENLIRRK